MKATGIVRRIDELGRIVVPKEIRRTLRIREGDSMEVYTSREGEIVLKKYSPVGEIMDFAAQYAKVLSETTEKLVCITDKDHVIAAFGPGKKEFEGQPISSQLEMVINDRRDVFVEHQKDMVPIVESMREGFCGEMISIVNVNGDAYGAVVLLAEEEISSQETVLVKTTASYLGGMI